MKKLQYTCSSILELLHIQVSQGIFKLFEQSLHRLCTIYEIQLRLKMGYIWYIDLHRRHYLFTENQLYKNSHSMLEVHSKGHHHRNSMVGHL